ncbi:MAG: hypothetical protein V3R68_00775 [Gammaproteobacteria bacterium]
MLQIKKVETIYKHSYFSFAGTLVAATIVFFLFQPVAQKNILILWFLSFVIFTFIRFIISWRFDNNEHSDTDIEHWFILFSACSIISGMFWGITGFILIPGDDFPLLESVIFRGCLLLFISALITGAIITYSTSKTIFLSFAVPAIIPQCLYLIHIGDKYHSMLGGIILLYVTIIYIVSIYINRIFISYTKLEIENELLKSFITKKGFKIKSY